MHVNGGGRGLLGLCFRARPLERPEAESGEGEQTRQSGCDCFPPGGM